VMIAVPADPHATPTSGIPSGMWQRLRHGAVRGRSAFPVETGDADSRLRRRDQVIEVVTAGSVRGVASKSICG
jgi:hypothetical protein